MKTPRNMYLFWDPMYKVWIAPVDDPPGGEGILAATTRADAEAMAAHQADCYGIQCKPVKFKLTPLETKR